MLRNITRLVVDSNDCSAVSLSFLCRIHLHMKCMLQFEKISVVHQGSFRNSCLSVCACESGEKGLGLSHLVVVMNVVGVFI